MRRAARWWDQAESSSAMTHQGAKPRWLRRQVLHCDDGRVGVEPVDQRHAGRDLARDNLFTVGDELQSIYGFRYAEVEIFRERRAALAAHGAALALTRNFRARPPLIAAVNAVFAARFGDAYTPLLAARAEPPHTEPAVELLLTDRRGWEESPHAPALAGELPPAPLWRHAEARLLAQRVAELVQAGDAAAGEIVLLLRAAGDLAVYERALQEHGVRTLAAVGSFWGQQQVGDLLAWLRALANPLDEEALYGLLASPLGRCSRDCLALIAQAAQASRESIWVTLQRACDGEGELAQRLTLGDLAANP